MAKREIETVIFDIGGVLIDWDPRHLYRQLFHDRGEMERFLTEICSPEWHHDHDLGEDIHSSCLRLSRRHPRHAEMIMAWAERGEEMIAGQFDDTVEVLAAVKAEGKACYALSNMEREAYTIRRTRFPFLAWFDGLVISGIEGIAKPDPGIFELLLERHQLEPRTSVFIDDSAANIATARDVGLATVHFRSAAQLKAELRALGLDLPG